MAFLKSIVFGFAIGCLAGFSLYSVEAAGKIHRAGPRPSLKNAGNTDEFSGDLSAEYNPWFYAIIGTLLVGLTGIFPLLVIPVEAGQKLREGGNDLFCILYSIFIARLKG